MEKYSVFDFVPAYLNSCRLLARCLARVNVKKDQTL